MSSLFKSHALVLTGILISATAIAEEHKAYVQFNAGAAFSPSFTKSNQFVSCNNFFGCQQFTSTYKEDYDTGFAGSVAIGYQVANQFRLEGEALYQSNDRDKFQHSYSGIISAFNSSGTLKGERERTAFLLNGYYDFKNSTAFTPYITAGMGGYHLRLKGGNSSVENDLDFAWQAGAGINYKLDDRISFDLKYRYFGGTDAELQIPSPSGVLARSQLYEVGDHQIMAGIRVGF